MWHVRGRLAAYPPNGNSSYHPVIYLMEKAFRHELRGRGPRPFPTVGYSISIKHAALGMSHQRGRGAGRSRTRLAECPARQKGKTIDGHG